MKILHTVKVEYKYTVPTTEHQISSVLNNFAIVALVPTNINGMFILPIAARKR